MNRLAADLELSPPIPLDCGTNSEASIFFITGGTGFFGCWLVESFCYVNNLFGLGARATILSRNPAAFFRKCPHLATDTSVALLPGDVRRHLFVSQGEYGYIIHGATEASAKLASEDPFEMLSTIVSGTERVLQLAIRSGRTKFLLTEFGRSVWTTTFFGLTDMSEDYLGGPNPVDP